MTKLIGAGATWIDNTIEDYEREQRERDRRPLTEKADPLALSWASYHVWCKFPGKRWISWNDVEAGDHDREIAEATRRYYRDKLAMRALKSSQPLTKFSTDLYEICNGGILRECHRGMLYRLPYLYTEDVKREALLEHTLSHPGMDSLPMWLEDKTTRRLQKHSRIFHSRRSREVMEYWFHDRETGYAVKWPVAFDNPLRSLVEAYWKDTHEPLIHARWGLGHDRLNNFTFWVMMQPEIRFE